MTARFAIGFLVFLFGGCQSVPPTGSPTTGSTGPQPSMIVTIGTSPATPTAASPAPTATDTPVVFRPDATVRVVTNGLRMRTAPGTGANSVKLDPLLGRGVLANVLAGPVSASGYDWYKIFIGLRLVANDCCPALGVGWVAAAAKDGTPWIALDPPDCTTPPPDPFEQSEKRLLECFAGRVFTFQARLGGAELVCGEGTPGWGIEPGWFDDCQPTFYLFRPTADLADYPFSAPSIALAIAPGVDMSTVRDPMAVQPEDWSLVSVMGQFDHPAAADCHAVLRPGYESLAGRKPDAQAVVYWCRTRFTITGIKPFSE